MADEGAHLVDHVLPKVPYRQWVLTLPYALRYRLAWDQSLRDAVLRIFTSEVERFYVRSAEAAGVVGAKAGGISVLHRFDSALKSDVHWHLLFADGCWAPSTVRPHGQPGPLAFHPAQPLQDRDVPAVLTAIQRRVCNILKRRGLLQDDPEQGEVADAFAADQPAMAAVLKASLFDKSVVEAGTPPKRERGPRPEGVRSRGRNCAELDQFTVHANSRIAPLARDALEKMIRYLCRPALAAGRVELLENDTVVRLKLKSAWRDGTTHIRIAAPDFVLRLVALIPLPRRVTLRYHGVFAPASSWRRQIVLHTARPRVKVLAASPTEPDCDHPHPHPEPTAAATAPMPSRLPYAEIFRRVFKFDVLDCECGGKRHIIATIPQGAIAQRILAHLRLPLTATGYLPIRAPPWDDFEWAYAAGNDDAVDEVPADDVPFFDAAA